METTTDSLLVATDRQRAFIRVLGRGSFKISPALKQFGQKAADLGCSEFVIDMEPCLGMDSTFMGVIAGLALRLKRDVAGRVILINLNPKNDALLRTLGLDRLVAMGSTQATAAAPPDAPASGGGLSPLETGAAGKKLTAETMLAAHEDLVRFCPENMPRFQDVLAYLKEEVKRAGGGDEKAK